ncbi:MAG TPA: SCO6880 family protein [Acidimicrobiales bacterium]|nr:SCO6880 family protein [Acidimicrobiales bacterium]
MTTEARRYRFPPLERRGVVVGIGGPQLAVLAAGCIVAVGTIRAALTVAGLLIATGVMALASAGAFWSVAGRPPGSWLTIGVGWLRRRATGPETSGGPTDVRPPRMLAGIAILSAPALPGSPPMGVVKDKKAGTLVAVLPVRGRSFSLLDPSEKERRLGAWGAVLAAIGRDGSPVYRLQWLERTVPGSRDGLDRYLRDAATSDTGLALDSYRELITDAGPVGQAHEVLLAIAINPRRASRTLRTFGRGDEAACGLLQRELRLLQGRLRSAELIVDSVLTKSQLAQAVRMAVDPAVRHKTRLRSPWPTATDESWSRYRTDSAWHATYWVADWPRLDVGPDFLSPLLLNPGGRRTLAVVMAPVAPARAAREVEAARTADLADEQLRHRAGFLTTARRRREAEGVLQREGELADGHAEYRFSGYLTVTAADEAELDAACAEVEQSAQQAHLDVRRLYGQQAEAFTWTLPLARGMA